MNLVIIIWSHKKKSQSLKIWNYIKQSLSDNAIFDDVKIMDLFDLDLPFRDEDFPKLEWIRKEIWPPISDVLDQADAFVIISPEYNGSVPARLKNFFLFKSTLLSHKPAMLVGVSSGTWGAYPISELRMSGYKNTKICYIPDHVIVRQAELVLNEPSPDLSNPHDQTIRERIHHNLSILCEYSKALVWVRLSWVDLDRYPNGM